MDLPLTALIAAGAAILGALIPTVSNYLVAERNRRFPAVEKWNEKFWERRFAAYQDFFAALQELSHLTSFMLIDAREAGGRLTPELYDKHSRLIDDQLRVLGQSVSKGLLLFERGFQQLAEAHFDELPKEGVLPPEDRGHLDSLERSAKQYERLIVELEPIARDHLNPKHLAGTKGLAQH